MTLPADLTAAALAEIVGGELEGAADVAIRGLESVDRAREGDLTFIADSDWASEWPKSAASAALVSRSVTLPDGGPSRAVIRVDDADAAMITILERFAPEPESPPIGVHPSAVVDPSAIIDPTAAIGPQCCVGAGCRVGARSILVAGVRLYRDAIIGEDSVLHASVTVRERCVIGRRVTLHCGVAVGTDGFGYRPSPTGLIKVPHLGNVVIGDDVEIGANTCIDRGKFGSTVIGAGTKIDNLCQIAHNCRIGRSCALSGLVGLAGSVTIGDGTLIGGGTGVADHLTIGRGVTIAAKSGVMNDIPDGETWAGYPAQERTQAMREAIAVRKLPDLVKKLKQRMGES
ncbi:MAG: UDP-3-O-(3-hydroxymyristoyl)glucosamine N-acyltransferase [Phycisphaerales bacterium]